MTTLASPIPRKRPWLKKTIVSSLALIGVTVAGTKLSLAIRDARIDALRAATT
jgi:hypothetical protein